MYENLKEWAEGLFTRQERTALLFILVVTSAGLALMAWQKARPAPAAAWVRLEVRVNAASAEDLTALPGIGATLADRILLERRQRGSFLSLRDLLRVRGITPKILYKLRGKVRFD